MHTALPTVDVHTKFLKIMTVTWLANERGGGQCMHLAGASMMAAVSPVFLKTYILCSYLST
jgi:hypothetical protein